MSERFRVVMLEGFTESRYPECFVYMEDIEASRLIWRERVGSCSMRVRGWKTSPKFLRTVAAAEAEVARREEMHAP